MFEIVFRADDLLNVNGGFTQNGGTYVVEANAAGQSDRINVAGAATINGGAVQLVAAPGTYANSTTYTILNATGGLGGTTFTGLTFSGSSISPGARNPHLTYDANNV